MKIPGMKLFNQTMAVMGQSLNLRLARHGMISSNMANIDTPGFKVRDVKFKQAMQRAVGPDQSTLPMRVTKVGHMPPQDLGTKFSVSRRDMAYSMYGRDEKGHDVVDIDQEMNKLAKNHLMYNTTVQMLAKKFEGLKNAIQEGGR